MASFRAVAALGAALVTALLTGCGKPTPFNATDLTGTQIGTQIGTDFALSDHYGKPRRLNDFADKAVVIFFGYTQCPDVCPTTLTKMREVMNLLDKDSERVQVVFVTLDPERDTKELLAQYVPSFHSSFLGLFGDAAATALVAKEFKIFYQKQPGSSPTTYTIDHSAGSYVFDPKGKLRLYLKHSDTSDAIAQDLRRLLAGE